MNEADKKFYIGRALASAAKTELREARQFYVDKDRYGDPEMFVSAYLSARDAAKNYLRLMDREEGRSQLRRHVKYMATEIRKRF